MTLNNTSYNQVLTRLTITIYDEAQVPIGFYETSTNRANGTTIISASIMIPSWAFVGRATIYVDLLDERSNPADVPYSKEQKATFLIER
jgi:hypothetical protein